MVEEWEREDKSERTEEEEQRYTEEAWEDLGEEAGCPFYQHVETGTSTVSSRVSYQQTWSTQCPACRWPSLIKS